MTAAGALKPHHRFWPEGLPFEAPPVRTTLPAQLAGVAAQLPDKAALIFNGSTVPYARLWRRIEACAAFLRQRLQVQPGDRVLLVGQNSPSWIVACQAVLRAGAVAVPVSPMCKAGELAFHAQDSGARVALVDADIEPLLRWGDGSGQLAAAVVLERGDSAGDAADTGPNGARRLSLEQAITQSRAERLDPGPLPSDPDALALLPYTSGTTGQPKGCRHTHATLLASLFASAAWKPVPRDAVVLAVAPLFHMLGLQNGMNLPLVQGATVVLMPRWHAATAAELIERHRVSVWSAPPAMVIDLFAHPQAASRDLGSLRMLSGGGAAMPEAVAAMLKQRFGIVYQEGYGMTETASFLHANPPARCKRQCLGVPTQGVDSCIVDPDTLAELPPGEVGELVTQAPQVMLGYWRRPDADTESFFVRDGKRYFRTGDLARTDEDGYFFMADRLKRMINVSGYKVWPAEVEAKMYAHPAIHEACVIAVPDARQGESVKAVVVLKPGVASAPSAEQLIAWCREQMAVYKAPRQVQFVESLPKSGTGKIAWRELQEAHARRAADADPT